jgi:hypothetical protein
MVKIEVLNLRFLIYGINRLDLELSKIKDEKPMHVLVF